MTSLDNEIREQRAVIVRQLRDRLNAEFPSPSGAAIRWLDTHPWMYLLHGLVFLVALTASIYPLVALAAALGAAWSWIRSYEAHTRRRWHVVVLGWAAGYVWTALALANTAHALGWQP